MTVSTGIGGALYLEDELYYGGFWHAGEIGLFVLEEDGRPSDSGSVNGVIEMYASGRGFSKNFVEAGGPEIVDGRTPGGPEISGLAKEGNKAALRALELEGLYLGRAIANACALVDFKKIILGGGLSLLFEQYQEILRREFARIQPERNVEIEATRLGYSGAFLGAAAVAVRGLEGFCGSKGAGKAEECVFHVKVGQDSVESVLELEGMPYACHEASFGSFLAAKTIEDPGQNLNQLVKAGNLKQWEGISDTEETKKVLFRLGSQIGKAVACAAILLDPGKVTMEGLGTQSDAFQEGLLETVKRETYYRGNLPFTVQWTIPDEKDR